MITDVQDVYYNVQDMSRAIGFYRDQLGLNLVDENAHFSAFEVGGVRLGLHWTGGSPVPEIPRDAHGAHAGATLTLLVRNAPAAYEQLLASGVQILGFSENPWGALLVIEDPDGNVLKLMQPPD